MNFSLYSDCFCFDFLLYVFTLQGWSNCISDFSYLRDQNWLSNAVWTPHRFLLLQHNGVFFFWFVYPIVLLTAPSPALFKFFTVCRQVSFLTWNFLPRCLSSASKRERGWPSGIVSSLSQSALAFSWQFGLWIHILVFGSTLGLLGCASDLHP